MRTIFTSLIAAGLSATLAYADPAGYTTLSFDAPHHGRGVVGAIWYPTAAEGRSFLYAENPVFQGMIVHEEARVQAGAHPVVLLSHGMGGNIRSLAWLATGLAERGAVVVAVNHPNSTWRDFDLRAGSQHWTRAQDLSLALDKVMADPLFEGHLDSNRVMAAGFSYGGWTALSLGGVRGNHQGYLTHCKIFGAASSHCNDLMGAEIRLADIDSGAWNASYADPRITHVTALDPGFVWGLSASDVAGLVENARLIGLGDGADRLLAADFDQSGFGALLPDAQIDNIVPATHFTAMPLCKPMGAAILIEEEDDPVCTDPVGAERETIHRQIIAAILNDLDL